MYVNRFLGRSLQFTNGYSVGFNWVHGNGETSKTSAILAGFHHPDSITWRWALYWEKPALKTWRPSVYRWKPRPTAEYGSAGIYLPLLGGLTLSWQAHMFRNSKRSPA